MNIDITPNPVILDVLRQAAAAHGVFEAEELGGVFDEQWPEWYAAHMTRTLDELGYRLVAAPASADTHSKD
ncbi:MAG: hypothetical protein K0S05_2287 [Agromyces sp.]|jgi:hypothetical protein|nr:hypothetical protein [Agromyces sp.]